MKVDINALRELYEKTTQGEWRAGTWKDCIFAVVGDPEKSESWKEICRIKRNSDELKEGNPDLHDAEWIVTSHNQFPDLAQEIEDQNELINRLSSGRDYWKIEADKHYSALQECQRDYNTQSQQLSSAQERVRELEREGERFKDKADHWRQVSSRLYYYAEKHDKLLVHLSKCPICSQGKVCAQYERSVNVAFRLRKEALQTFEAVVKQEEQALKGGE